MDEEKRLHGAMGWQAKTKHTGSRLGEDIVSYMKQHHSAFEKNARIMDVWERAVPGALLPYCRPDKRVGNVLYIQVMPGAYMHQMQMLSSEVLENIQRLSPRCGIQKLRLIPLQQTNEDL